MAKKKSGEKYSDKYWYDRYMEMEKNDADLATSLRKQIGERDGRIEALTEEKKKLEYTTAMQLAQAEAKLERLKELAAFDDYLTEYDNLLCKTWVISVSGYSGYREGQQTRDLRVAEVTRMKEVITLIDPMPERQSFSSTDYYLCAAKKYLEALKDIDKTRKTIEEYQYKYPSIRSLAEGTKGTSEKEAK